jgi:competence protein ComEC
MERSKRYLPYILLVLLCISAFYIWFSVYTIQGKSKELKVAFLDVGQGDAIYVEAPNGRQMLIDGGPGPIVLSKLAEVMPFADRSIDMLVVTNPDADHMAGLVDVLERYTVGQIFEPGTTKDTSIYQRLEAQIKSHAVKKTIAHRGMHIVLDRDKNIYFDILFPDRDVSSWSSNDGSIVGKLVYGTSSFLLMGDATKYTELLVSRNETLSTLRADVLKLGHHGSSTSSSELWVKKVQPQIAIISAGKNNRYGHPHQDVTKRLSALHIPYVGTYQKGTIIFKTDGTTLSY